MSITAPSAFTATCMNCETYRTFMLTNGDSDRAVGIYECEACEQQAELDLQP